MKHFTYQLFLAIFILSISVFECRSQISGTNSVLTINANTATAVDPGLTITASGNITNVNVQIMDGYISGGSGDILGYTGSLPSGVTSSFDNSKGILYFTGITTSSNWQTLLRTVTLKTTSAACFANKRSVTFVLENRYYNPSNGHYYRLDVTGNWASTKAAASASNYSGQEGYLATINSLDENNFLFSIVGAFTYPWIGASDNYLQINAATGTTTYANQAAADGNFYWISGPEAGTQFSTKNSWEPGGTSSVSGRFMSWLSGSPDDYPGLTTASPGEEDYVQFYSNNANWNDADGTLGLNSIIEYGDMPNDQQTNNIPHSTRNIFINSAPSGIISGDVLLCSGSSSATFTLTPPAGTFSVTRWEKSIDQYFTSPSSISNTTTTLNVTGITENAYYRAIVNSSSPSCTNLPTSSAKVSINNVSGTWTGASNNNWTLSSNWCGGVPSITTDVIIPSGIEFFPNVDNNGTCRNLTINAIGNITFTTDKKLEIAGIIRSNKAIDATVGEISMIGGVDQFIPASAFKSNKIKTLTINNSNGVTISSGNITVTGTLVFSSGHIISSSANLLIIDDNAVTSGENGSRFVNGPLRKIGDDAFIFPIGYGNKYAPCEISNPSNVTDYFTSEYFKKPYDVLAKSGLSKVSDAEYWIVDRSGSSGVNLALYCYDNYFSGIVNSSSTNDLIVAHFNSASQYWEDLGGSKGISSITGGIKVLMSVSSFSPFTFGSPSGVNPLPIKLIDFVAIPNNANKTVELSWATTSEENSKYYEVLHTVDFVKWNSIGIVKSNGPNSQLNEYTFNHMNPSSVNHYKLKEVDNNGDFTYSDVKLARFNDLAADKILIYPNPTTGSLTITNAGDDSNYEIIDLTGRVILKGNFNQSTQILNLPNGVYMIKIVSDGIIQNEKIIVQ